MKDNVEQLQESTARLDLSKKTSPPLTPRKRANYANIEMTADTKRGETNTWEERNTDYCNLHNVQKMYFLFLVIKMIAPLSHLTMTLFFFFFSYSSCPSIIVSS